MVVKWAGVSKNTHCQNYLSVLIIAEAQTSFQCRLQAHVFVKELILINSGTVSCSLILCNYVIDHNAYVRSSVHSRKDIYAWLLVNLLALKA